MEDITDYLEEHTGATLAELQISYDIEVIYTAEARSYALFVHDEFFGEYEHYDVPDLAEDINYITRSVMV